MTPDHYGQTDAIHAARQNMLDHALRNNPERFVNKAPTPFLRKPTAAWIKLTSVNAEDPSLNADPGCIKVVGHVPIHRPLGKRQSQRQGGREEKERDWSPGFPAPG